MTGRQLDFFSGGGVQPASPAQQSGMPRGTAPSDLGDAALVAAIRDAGLADAPSLAAEAGQRRLAAASPLSKVSVGGSQGSASSALFLSRWQLSRRWP
jgi:hypothetical protein